MQTILMTGAAGGVATQSRPLLRRAYPVEVRAGCTVVEHAYVAERVTVSVEEDYVVIDV